MDVSHFNFMHKDHRDSERKYYRASRRKNDLISRIFLLTPLALIIGNVFATILLTRASLENYPGGQALAIFHQSISNNNTRKQSIFLSYISMWYPHLRLLAPPHIHISNLAAQSGASLFLQLHSSPHYYHQSLSTTHDEWNYNKTENLPISALCSLSSPVFTHLISEIPPSKDPLLDTHWYTVEVIKGFDRWSVDWDLLKAKSKNAADLSKVLRLVASDKLWILARKK